MEKEKDWSGRAWITFMTFSSSLSCSPYFVGVFFSLPFSFLILAFFFSFLLDAGIFWFIISQVKGPNLEGEEEKKKRGSPFLRCR